MTKLSMPNPHHSTYAEMKEAAGKNLKHLTACLLNHILLFHPDPETALAALRFTIHTLEQKLQHEIEKKRKENT